MFMKLKGQTLLKKMKHHRRHWERTLDLIIEKGLENTPVSQKWFLRDVVAHVLWYETELLSALERQSIIDSDFWNMEVEARNDMIYLETQSRALDELREDSQTIFLGLLKKIESISDEDLNSDTYIKRRKGTRVTHDFIGGITFWHWEEHEDSLINIFDLDY